MIRYLVLTVGRPITLLILICATLFLLIVAIQLLSRIPLPDLAPSGPIAPNEALAQGGHTVVVSGVCEGSGEPLESGTYRVITLDGRP